jgi:hypothetical protein
MPHSRAASSPALDCLEQLGHWLRLSEGELLWFCDTYGNTARRCMPRLRHYRHRWVPKRSGGLRLLEIPKARLKRMQRRVLDELLSRVAVHPAATGFVRGRSCLDHARTHVGARWIVTMDLRDWFASISRARIAAQFRRLGADPRVADALARLCTVRTPTAIVDEAAVMERPRLRTPHLPQGAPTSPALANLVASGLDRRLAGYARHAGLNYSRYADDIALSPQAGVDTPPQRVVEAVQRIARSEVFVVNPRKIRIRRNGSRMSVCGIVVNERLNLARDAYDRLRVAVHRIVTGPAPDASALAEIRGRLSWLATLNPRRASKLGRQLQEKLKLPPA